MEFKTDSQVFISYEHSDVSIAREVCNELKARKISVWFAPQALRYSDDFSKEIIQAINNCRAFVFIHSKNVYNSYHAKGELLTAINRKKRIVAYCIDELNPKDDLYLLLNQVHWGRGDIDSIVANVVDLVDPRGEWIEPNTECVYSINKETFKRCNKDLVTNGYEILPGTKVIGINAFSGCKGVKSIILPDGVTTIEARAFYDTCITSIILPKTITTIEDDAFKHCTALRDLTLPSSVEVLGTGVFKFCKSLENIYLSMEDKQNFIFSDGALYTANKERLLFVSAESTIIDFKVPPTVQVIDSGAFSSCSSLTSVVFSDKVKTINSDMFMGCRNLRNVTLPYLVECIDICAFAFCSKLESIIIPETVIYIGNMAFSNCKELKSIEIAQNTTHISNFAFNNCTKLKDVKLPDAIKYIGDSAFEGCVELAKINIPNSIKQIGPLAFMYCNKELRKQIPDRLQLKCDEYFGCAK